MGRSFASVRQEVKNTSDRWGRAARTLGEEDRKYAGQIVAMAKRHSSEEFYIFDDPFEAAVFSVLIELLREMNEQEG